MNPRNHLATVCWKTFPTLQFKNIFQLERSGERLAHAFGHETSETWGITSFVDDDPKWVLASLERIANETTGIFVLYVVSHGYVSSTEEYCFATTDSQNNLHSHQGIRLQDLLATVSGTRPRRKLILLDACSSGVAIREPLTSRLESDTVIITSTAGATTTTVDIADGITQFASALCSALERAGPTPALTISDIVTNLKVQGAEFDLISRGLIVNEHLLDAVPEEPSIESDRASFRILILEDESDALEDLFQLVAEVESAYPRLKVDTKVCRTLSEASATLGEYFDLAICDLFFPTGTSAPFIIQFKARSPSTTMVVATKSASLSYELLDVLLPQLFGSRNLVDLMYIKGTGQVPLRRLIESAMGARSDVIGSLPTIGDLVASLGGRYRTWIHSGHKPSGGKLLAEVIACVSHLCAFVVNLEQQLGSRIGSIGLTVNDTMKSSFVMAKISSESSPPLAPALILKLGPRTEVERELRRHQDYVRFLTDPAEQYQLGSTWLGPNIGGLLLLLPSSSRFPFASATDEQPTPSQMQCILSYFRPRAGGTPRSDLPSTTQLFDYYSSIGFNAEDARASLLDMAEFSKSAAGLPQQATAVSAVTRARTSRMVRGDFVTNALMLDRDGDCPIVDSRNVAVGPRSTDLGIAFVALIVDSAQQIPRALTNDEVIRDSAALVSGLVCPDEGTRASSIIESPPYLKAALKRVLQALKVSASLEEEASRSGPLLSEEVASAGFIAAVRRFAVHLEYGNETLEGHRAALSVGCAIGFYSELEG